MSDTRWLVLAVPFGNTPAEFIKKRERITCRVVCVAYTQNYARTNRMMKMFARVSTCKYRAVYIRCDIFENNLIVYWVYKWDFLQGHVRARLIYCGRVCNNLKFVSLSLSLSLSRPLQFAACVWSRPILYNTT